MSLPNSDLGDLQKFDINVITSIDFASKEENAFVIALAVVFNDMKDYFWVHQMMVENPPSNPDEISAYRGQVSGMSNFVLKHLIGLFWEFTILLKENQSVLNANTIKFVESKLGKTTKEYWDDLKVISILHKSKMRESDKKVVNCLVKIRNNMSHHYYGIKNFSDGICCYKENGGADSKTYFSVGDRMEKTRFFFADAASQFYMKKVMDECETNDVEIIEYIKKMNQALRYFVEGYIVLQNKILNGSRDERRSAKKERKFE